MSHPDHGEVNAFLDPYPSPPLASTCGHCLAQILMNVLSRILNQSDACPVVRPKEDLKGTGL